MLPTDRPRDKAPAKGVRVLANHLFCSYRQTCSRRNFNLNLCIEFISILVPNRALRGTEAGLNLVEFCWTGKNSENFSIVKACAGRERDQIMGLRGGSEIKI